MGERKRRIVQFVALPETELRYEALIALDDDGLLWGSSRNGSDKWLPWEPVASPLPDKEAPDA